MHSAFIAGSAIVFPRRVFVDHMVPDFKVVDSGKSLV